MAKSLQKRKLNYFFKSPNCHFQYTIAAHLKRNLKYVTWNDLHCLFLPNRGDTLYSITVGFRQGSLAKPLSLLFLTPRPTLSSHRTLICLFWSQNLHFLWHLVLPGFPKSDHTVSKLSADADSLWNTAKQASRPQAILKTQPPIFLVYRARNRPQLERDKYVSISWQVTLYSLKTDPKIGNN